MYLDNILHVKNISFDEHLQILDHILSQIKNAGLQVNAAKSNWCAKKLTFLGFLLTKMGYKTLAKCIEAILAIAPPKNLKHLHCFIGCINFIKNHIPRCVELLKPLTWLIWKGFNFKWTQEQQGAFQKIKAAISESIMLMYPNSDYAIGDIVMQDGCIISCFSKKFTPTQQKYATMNKELLAGDEMFKHHHNIIYRCGHHQNRSQKFIPLQHKAQEPWSLMSEPLVISSILS